MQCLCAEGIVCMAPKHFISLGPGGVGAGAGAVVVVVMVLGVGVGWRCGLLSSVLALWLFPILPFAKEVLFTEGN